MSTVPPALDGSPGSGDADRGRTVVPDHWGILPGYEDAFGNWREVSDATRHALVQAMGSDQDRGGSGGGQRAGAGIGAGATGSRTAGEVLTCHPLQARTWGFAVQLYAARSRASWGIGDFADLRALGGWSRDLGAGVLMVNPLDAPIPLTPRQASPYYPSSRRFRDPVYLRVEDVPGADRLAPDLAPLAHAGRRLNRSRTVDRDAVWRLKHEALRRVWRATGGGRGDDGFTRFRDEQGRALERFALFSVLAADRGCSWRHWPESLRVAEPRRLRGLAADHADDVAFVAWQQWLCDEQLRRAGAELPLLRDLPVGFDPGGADAWQWQHMLADGVTLGAPPDALGPVGQDWQLPAFVPSALLAAELAPVTETLRASFRHAGGLRIDHVLGLFRLFWIPPGRGPADGAYVAQPTAELLDAVARTSGEARAFVVGEDLGTVGAGVRATMAERDLLRYQVWWFEEDPVDRWEPRALAAVTTHDLPTVAGVWTGADARMLTRLGQDPGDAWQRRLRARVVAATGVDADAPAAEASVALHALLAGGPSVVVVAQLDDALAVEERPNLPGTGPQQRPNWSLALPRPLEAITDDAIVLALAAGVERARRRHAAPSLARP